MITFCRVDIWHFLHTYIEMVCHSDREELLPTNDWMRFTVQVKCYFLSLPGIAHLPVHDKYDLNWQEIEKLKRECKKKDEEVKNLKKKFNEIQRHQQHFRTGSGEGVSSFFKVRHHLLILSVANWNNENICQTAG